MSPPLIAASEVGRRRPDGGWLLDRVTLALHPGERLALVGPSGSGKSLLLRSLALLDPLDTGGVLWRDAEVSDAEVPAYRAANVYLHQTPQLGGPRVRSDLEQLFSLRQHRRRDPDRRWVLDRLARLGRGEEFLDRAVSVLSGGEAQIVALLRAMQIGPEVLLLDEPTAAVDPEGSRAIEALVNEWFEEGSGSRAFIWVTHDPDQAARVTDRRLSIHEGALLPDGRP